MAHAAGILGTTRSTFYRWLRAGKIKGMKVGRQWRFYKEDIERFLEGRGPRVDLSADIGPLLAALGEQIEHFGGDPAENGPEDGVERAVREMMRLGLATDASDLHLEAGGEQSRLRYRIDGVLHELARFDGRLHDAVVRQWKRMAACDVEETRVNQDGRVLIHLPGRDDPADIRVSVFPAHRGEAVTARFLLRSRVQFDLDWIDFSDTDRERLLRALDRPYGILIVGGPTGCGKTTTLYSSLVRLNRPEVKVMTVEDPVEYAFDGMIQTQANPAAGWTFARALRAMLRSDPDVLFVGEIRGPEVLQLAAQAALTGHLVLSALHTDDAPATLVRMVDIGLDPFVVSDATQLVLSQRLIRKLCPDCAREGRPDATRLGRLSEMAQAGGLAWDTLLATWREPVGCEQCKFTGYRGRTVVAETLEVTGEVAAAVARGASVGEIRTLAVGQGMTTMAADGLRRAAAGETSIDEVLRVAPGA